jgi:transketolase
MKKAWWDELLKFMDDPRVYVLFLGLGWPRYEEFKKLYPDRVFNLEASEQAALDIACGLSLEGKIPFVYSITPFLLWRGAETIRTYINHEKMNVKLIGAGRNDDYGEDGFSHDARDAEALLAICFPNIKTYWPKDKEELNAMIKKMIGNNGPSFLSLRRY